MTVPVASAADLADAQIDDVIDRFGRQEVHVGADESESPWVPFPGVENVWIRHLAFDLASGSFANILRVGQGGRLGRHRHRGPVSAYVLEGSWRYLEYDWVARKGDWVREMPGKIHTLVSDDPQGMTTVFWLNGSLEFFDDEDNLVQITDVFWHLNTYVRHCEEHGLPINTKLFV